MKKRKYIVLPVVITLVITCAVIVTLRPRGVMVDAGIVDRGPLTVTVTEDGKTRIRNRFTVSAPVTGKLERIRWKAGDVITKDKDLLAMVVATDPALLDPRAQLQAEAKLHAAEALERQAASEHERAKVNHDYAVTNLARARKLLNLNGVSRQDFDNAEQTELSAGHALREAEFAVKVASFEREQAAAVLMKADRWSGNAGDSCYEIHAPVSGRVLRVFEESSTVVSPGTKLLEVGDPADLEVEVDVLSVDAVKIKPGAKVSIERWGGDSTLAGRVRMVEPAAFTEVSALGVEEQRVNVLIDFAGPAAMINDLGDAFRIEARIVTWETADTLRVSSGAVFRDRDQWAVFVITGERAVKREIQVGFANEEFTGIIGGLEHGDKVILYPSDLISDGCRIRTE